MIQILKQSLLFVGILCSLLTLQGCETASSTSSSDSSSSTESSSTETSTTKTLTDGDFSFELSDPTPNAGITETITIKPTDTTTQFKYALNTTRTSGTGTITYNSFITSGAGISLSSVSFTGDTELDFKFSNATDTHDINLAVKNSSGDILSSVTFNITVE